MAEVIKNYVFNKDKSFVIFNNKYYVSARHLTKVRSIPKGIQVYDNDNYIGNFGRITFSNDRLHIYQNNQEVAYCKVNDDFFNEITNQLPKVDQWTF